MSLMSFIQLKTIHELGAVQCFIISGTFFQRDLGKSEIYRMLEEAMWNEDVIS